MKSAIIHGTLAFLIVNIVMLTCVMTGCSRDEVVEEDITDSLFEEMGSDKADTDRLYEEAGWRV